MTTEEPQERTESKIGVVDELTTYISDHNRDTPYQWNLAIAETMFGTLLHPEAVYSTRKGHVRTNLHVVVIGESGIGKTPPLQYIASPILHQIEKLTTEYALKGIELEPVNHEAVQESEELTEDQKKVQEGKKAQKKLKVAAIQRTIIDSRLPYSFSMEEMTSRLTRRPNGIIISPEISSTFKAKISKTYAIEYPEFMSNIYDGHTGNRATRKSPKEGTDTVHVSFLGDTTPYIYSLMKRDDFIQGYGNRLLYNILGAPSFDPIRTEDEYDTSGENHTLVNSLENSNEQFASKLSKFYIWLKENAHNITYVPDYDISQDKYVWDKLAEYKTQLITERKKFFENKQRFEFDYLAKLRLIVDKFVLIYTYSEIVYPRIAKNAGFSTDPRDGKLEVLIPFSVIEKAKSRTEYYKEQFFKLLKEWKASETEHLSVLDYSSYVERLVSVMRERFNGEASRSDLLTVLHWKAQTLDDVTPMAKDKMITYTKKTDEGYSVMMYKLMP